MSQSLAENYSGRIISSVVILLALIVCPETFAGKKRRPPSGGRVAVVADERLAALREEPDSSSRLVQRLGRGRAVSITGSRRAPDGQSFFRVAVTRRTRGWLPAEALVSPSVEGGDERLLKLVRASEGFERVARARLFLDTFPASKLRPTALLIYGEAAEESAEKLSREAARRLEDVIAAESGGAPSARTYFMNYVGLDRFNRIGVGFTFERETKRLRYDGAAWREILRRHPNSPEAASAQKRLDALRDAGLAR